MNRAEVWWFVRRHARRHTEEIGMAIVLVGGLLFWADWPLELVAVVIMAGGAMLALTEDSDDQESTEEGA